MKVTRKMIAPNLRWRGEILKSILPWHSKRGFYFSQFLLDQILEQLRPAADISFEEVFIDRTDGSKLRLCIYKSKDYQSKDALPGLLWFHGGGYAMGRPEIETGIIEGFIRASPAVIIAPDYQLSLEKPYPAALDDAYLSLLWMKNNHEELGIREDQLFIGGESAGGGLTCALSAYARDRGEVSIAFQIPLYPMLDDREQTDSEISNNAPIWDQKANILAWKLYLGNGYGSSDVPFYAAPARLTNFKNLPPTYSFVGSIEPFYDETKAYIEKINSSGGEAELDVYEGCYHAFNMVAPNSSQGKEANKKLFKVYQKAVKTYFASQQKDRKKGV
ncbi:alpha/beta hydrolase [Streptococcaceae bacterium ESL0729]|nr:alpha/beta hydrolase [Streptococcaceae bacterium ESL0729]